MNLGAPEVLILIVVVGMFVLPVWGIVDAAMRPDDQWQRANRSKVLWIVAQLLFGGIAAIIYLASVRPTLRANA